ncbi:DUF3243 domain-containing protein [Paenibacillus lactis]|uniref:DUF3243 domain-containing protein n=1 Tax=Paenibacillus lactis TaxID=228574 RepID=A0ABS4F4U5_9BACL|nr:DUF3243 domain-containing protein [Paenibacillus lactis]MBP1891122.1 hypothetical protein [Paenibacillus lactis]MCM3493576.1 DUF3243 domain-containing protein [Paenibacillus lactis]HAG00455.1 DUF3243 domain-containing protein [Paenibacillus lactis]
MSEHNHVVNKNGELDVSKVDDAIDRIDDKEKERILADFDSFQAYLNKRIQLAESIGLNEEQLAQAAEKVAGYLAANEEPRNSEEKLLQELWKVGTPEEQHQLAHLLVKLAQKRQA